MQIEFLHKTDQSYTGNCPAIYEAPGGYVVQGKILDAETRAQLRDLDTDETAVFVPADVINRVTALNSYTSNCPAIYEAPGGYVVQGKILDAETRAQLRDLDTDETAVFVGADVTIPVTALASS